MIIVSDTSPINYLMLVEEIRIVPILFGEVFIPPAVLSELLRPATPESVRSWISARPNWLELRSPSKVDKNIPLDTGEREAICLAEELKATLILIDDKKARDIAKTRGLTVAGTLNVLAQGAQCGLLNLERAIEKLSRTNFRASPKLLGEILSRYGKRTQ